MTTAFQIIPTKNSIMGYTTDRTIQILISLLKEHHIRKVVASPGTTNAVFVASLQNDPYFEIYSSVDERSGAYIACGLSQESGEPVVITCTEATASRNYLSALTEAHYRKLPILAITGYHHLDSIGHLYPQSIDRSTHPKDTVLLSVNVNTVKDKKDEWNANLLINKAILELRRNGGGPVHINLQSSARWELSAKELPKERKIERYSYRDEFPALPKGRIAISIGAHLRFSDELTETVERFCSQHNAVVFASHISGYHGKYKVNPALLGSDFKQEGLMRADLVIHIGENDATNIKSTTCWRVSEDGEVRDTFKVLNSLFNVDEITFFTRYNDTNKCNTEYWDNCMQGITQAEKNLCTIIDELPFCSTWIAEKTHGLIPTPSVIHFAILNSYRTWGLFDLAKDVEGYCNVGGYGIDGGLSTLIGTSLAAPDKLHFGVFGDLAFFYDMNSLGNRHVGNNLRILLINNGKGQEFRNYIHPAYKLGEMADEFVAAAGHYGNKSPLLVRHYVEDLGYEYITASNKDEYLSKVDYFTSSEKYNKPIVFEVFTEGVDESESLRIIQGLKQSPTNSLKGGMKELIHKTLGDDCIQIIKNVIKK